MSDGEKTNVGSWRLRVSVLLSALGLAVVSVLIVPRIGFVRQEVRDQVVERANAELDGSIQLGEVTAMSWTTLIVDDVEVRDRRGNVVARVDSVKAQWSLAPLAASSVVVDSVELEGVRAVVRRYADGGLNVSEIARPSEDDTPPPQWVVAIGKARVTGEVAYWDDSIAGEPPESLAELGSGAISDVARKTSSTRESFGAAAIRDLDVSAAASIDLTGPLAAKVQDIGAQVSADLLRRSLDVRGNDFEIRSRGRFVELDLGILAIDGIASLGDVVVSLEQGDEAPQRVSAVVGAISVEPAALELTQATVDAPPLVQPIRGSMRAALVGADATVQLDLLTDEGGTVKAAARVDGIEELSSAKWEVALDVSDFEASKWSPILDPLKRGSFGVWASGEGTQPDTAQGEATVRAVAVTVDKYRVDEAFVGLRWKAGEVIVDTLRVKSPYARAAGRGAVAMNGRTVVSLDVESRDALAEATSGVLQLDKDSEGFVSLDANLQLDFDAKSGLRLVEDGEVTAKWDIRSFGAEDVRIESSAGDLAISLDKTLESGARRFRAKINASGSDLRGFGYRVSSFAIDLNGGSKVRPPYGDAFDFTGELNSDLRLRVAGLSGPGLRVRSLRANTKTRAITGSKFSYQIDAGGSEVVAGDASLASAQTKLRGTVTVGSGARLRDVLRAIEINGTAGAEGLDAGSVKVQSAAADIAVAGPTQSLKGTLQLAARGAESGDYNFESLTTELALTGDRQFVIDAKGVQAEKTPKSIEAVILGEYAADLKSYTIHEVRFASGGQKWALSSGFRFSPDKGRFEFDDVKLKQGEQRVRIDGYLAQGKDQDLTVEVEELSIEELRETIGMEPKEGEPKVTGTISLNARLSGTSREPDATFDVWIRDLYVDGQGPFDAHLVGTYGDRRLGISELEGRAFGKTVLAGSASVPFRGTLEGEGEVLWGESFSVDVRIPLLQISEFATNLPILKQVGASGEVEASVLFDGRLRAPNVQVSLKGRQLVMAGKFDDKRIEVGPYGLDFGTTYVPAQQSGPGKLDITSTLQDEGGAVVPAASLKAELELDVPGWLEDVLNGRQVDWSQRVLDLPYSTNLTVDGFDLRKLGLATLVDADAEGIVDLTVNGVGTVASPNLSVDAKLQDFGWYRYRDVYFDLGAEIKADRVELRGLRLEWDADEIFTGSGKIPLPIRAIVGAEDLSDLPLQLAIQFARIPLAKLQAMDYTFASLAGTIGGYVRIDGRLSEPEISSRFSIVDTQFADRSRGTVAVDFAAADNRVDLIAQICRGVDPVIDLRASVPVNLDVPALAAGGSPILDGPVSGQLIANRVELGSLVPAKVLERFFGSVEGRMSADLKLAGTVEEPRVLGDLVVADAAVFLPSYGRRFEQIDLDVSFRPDSVRLKELELKDGKGSLEATGKIGMVSFKPDDLRLRVRAEELNTGGFTPFPMFLNADVDTTGVFDAGTFDGDIAISGLEVKIPETSNPDAFATELTPDIVLASDREQDGSGFLSLDELSAQTEQSGKPFAQFTVEIARDSWVRHPIGDVNLRGSLDVELSGAGAAIGGEVEAIRGDFELLGKRFEVRRGVVSFTGANPPEPRLDVEAVYLLDRSLTESIGQPTSGDPRVIVAVSGTPKKPDLKLSSDPQMPEDDIIYVLVTNRPPQESGVGEREGVANTALSAASGIFAGVLQQKLQGSIPVDVLRVEGGDDGFSDYRVEAGKYLTEDLFLSLKYQFGAEPDENATSIKVEYRFAPRWTVELEAGDKANGEANIFWDVY